MKRVCLLVLAGLIVAFISAPAIARHRGEFGPKAGRAFRGGAGRKAGCVVGMVLKLKEELGLSDSQVEQLEALKSEAKEQMKAGQEAVKAKREALQEAVKAGADESAISAAGDELGKALGDQAVLRLSIKAKIDGILTEDQQSKLKELKGQRAGGKPKAGKFAKGRKGSGRDPEAAFERIDTDGNGTISLEEFKAHREQIRERFAGRGPMMPMGPGPGGMGPWGPMGPRGHWGRRPGYPMHQPED
jgi:Spy/CpxP family protein refolding chaperone